MNNSVALIVLFNHRYDKNLPLLEDIYRNRFSNRFYLVPFYDGEQENVIPVYGRSIFFEGYIAQGLNKFYDKKFEHYLVVADDMVLNPAINENNYKEYFEIANGQSFVPRLMPLHEAGMFWLGTLAAFCYRKKQKYVEVTNELPSIGEAQHRFAFQGVNVRPLTRHEIFGPFTFNISSLANKARLAIRLLSRLRHPFKNEYELDYPMVGSYSDIVVVDSQSIKRFAHYCGVLASTGLFAEVAVPTALVLSAEQKIVTEATTKHSGMSFWRPGNVFSQDPESDVATLEQRFKDLDDIMNNFPQNYLYMHPIKLSQWMKKSKR